MDSQALRLSAAIDGLASALRRAGAPEEESAHLLELASIAALQALTLRAEIRASAAVPFQAPAVVIEAPLAPAAPLEAAA